MPVTVLARALSILGHPAVLMPAALVWAAVHRGASSRVLHTAIAISAFLVISVGAYSVARVRAGRWTHVDASVPQERSELNGFLSVLLFGAAAALWAAAQPPALISGLVVSGIVVVFAQLLRRWLKVSLHAAFAMFSAALVWQSPAVFALSLGLAVAVGWSRCELHRHTPREVLVGLLAGAAAGLGFGLLAH